MMRLILSTLIVLALVDAPSVTAADDVIQQLDTRPPSRRFQPDIDAGHENYSIEVDSDSRVFVGNSKGVLIYEGGSWRQVAVPT